MPAPGYLSGRGGYGQVQRQGAAGEGLASAAAVCRHCRELCFDWDIQKLTPEVWEEYQQKLAKGEVSDW